MVFLLFSARQYETLNHSHSIISETARALILLAFPVMRFLDTMKNTIPELPPNDGIENAAFVIDTDAPAA